MAIVQAIMRQCMLHSGHKPGSALLVYPPLQQKLPFTEVNKIEISRTLLQGQYIAHEPGLGLRHGCFNTWYSKKDITQQHSMVEMAYAYSGGNLLAGEVKA